MTASFRLGSLALVMLVFAIIPRPALGQTERERHNHIRTAVDRADLTTAINALQEWRSAQPNVFVFNNYDYLLARLAERSGDRATAAVNYQRVVARNSILSQYAVWLLAQFARTTGNLTLEREQLRQLIVTAPKSLLRDAAVTRLAQSCFESGDFECAIYELKLRSESAIGATKREALALLGQAYLRNNQPVQAREIFNRVISELPDPSRPDDFTLASIRALDLLDSGSEEAAKTSAPQLSEAEHLNRAKAYHFNRDFTHARLHYSAIVERYPQSTSVPDALFQIGRSFYQDGAFDQALPNFQLVVEKYPDNPVMRDAMGYAASSLSRLKRTDEAIATYTRLIDRYPDSPDADRPYLNAIDALRDGDRDQAALDWIERTRGRFNGKLAAALALFSRARIYMSRSDWPRALADLEALRNETDLGGTRVPGGTSATEISFLRGFVLEQMGKTNDAIQAYLDIQDGRAEYYGGRATERLRAMVGNGITRNAVDSRLDSFRRTAQTEIANSQPEKARQAAQSALRLTTDPEITREMFEVARRAYASLPAYNSLPSQTLLSPGRKDILTSATPESELSVSPQLLADELLFLGLYDEGTPELAVAEDSTDVPDNSKIQNSEKSSAAKTNSVTTSATQINKSRDEAYTLAVYFKRGESADRAVLYAEPLWKNVPRDYLIELAPRELVELLYPAPFADTLNDISPARGVDPRFVLSIMRQESRFRSDAKSISAARGLMQFIPATANSIASQVGKQTFRQDDLYNPKTAILFGSQYLGNLFKLFPGMPQAVAASYNGGEDNVARWVARAKSKDQDRYVAEIGFAQAKDYVHKVLANFRIYQSLYDERLKAR